MNKIPSLSALAAAALLAACASNPSVPQELVSARSTVHSAESDPQVLSYASLELKRATDALNRANEANAKGESLAEISSAAYVAGRHAQAAMAIAKSKSNEESIKAAEADRERARADARTAEAQRARAQAAAAQAEANAARAQASQASQQASRQVAQANMQAAQAQAAAASIEQQNAMLLQQLSELQAKSTDRGTLVTLGDVLFEFGRAEIKPSAYGAMQKLASYLKEHPERRILVEGYTDSVGSDTANLMLSQRRADAVASALASLGVAGDRINTKGYGEDYPIATNATDTDRALNRRVEVYISDSDQPVRARS